MQVTCRSRIKKNDPRHIDIVFLSILPGLMVSNIAGLESKCHEQALYNLRVNVAQNTIKKVCVLFALGKRLS